MKTQMNIIEEYHNILNKTNITINKDEITYKTCYKNITIKYEFVDNKILLKPITFPLSNHVINILSSIYGNKYDLNNFFDVLVSLYEIIDKNPNNYCSSCYKQFNNPLIKISFCSQKCFPNY